MHCWPRTLLWLVIVTIGTLNLVTACGQKGPLYLPPVEDSPATDQESGQ
jgi:predicted small lipoprotein YifL